MSSFDEDVIIEHYDINKKCIELLKPYVLSFKLENVVLMNPCLLLLNNGYVLLSCRVIANKVLSDSHVPETRGRIQLISDAVSRMSWDNLIDHTCFFIFRINDISTMTLLSVNRKNDIFFENCVDLRMFKDTKNNIYFTYNRYIKTKNSSSKKILNHDCSRACAFMYISKVVLIDPGLIIIEYMTPLCMSDELFRIQKNWTMFQLPEDGDNINISVWLNRDDSHQFMIFDTTSNTCQTKVVSVKNKLPYELPTVRNKLPYIKDMHISLGTPCVYDHRDNYNIGLGHVKVKSDESSFIFPNKQWKSHHNTDRNFEYAMFFYILNENKEVIGISNFFIPYSDTDYDRKIYFPVGLIIHERMYYISYGQGDKKISLIKISEQIVHQLFDNINYSNLTILDINDQRNYIIPRLERTTSDSIQQPMQLRRQQSIINKYNKYKYKYLTLQEKMNY